MKILSYLIAVVVLIASAWFSYDVKTKLQQKKESRVTLYTNNDTRQATVDKTRKTAVETEETRDSAQVALSDVEGDLRTQEDNLALVLREQATLNDKIAGQIEDIESTQALINTVESEFADLNVEIDEIPALIEELEEDVNASNVKIEELTELAASSEARVETTSGELSGLRQRVADRAQRLKGNALEGFITAVNHDWGIAVVNVPVNMPIERTTKLLVRRGTSYIGRLKISSIEGSKLITDIDYKSVNRGVVLQPGDTVFLEKPVTN